MQSEHSVAAGVASKRHGSRGRPVLGTGCGRVRAFNKLEGEGFASWLAQPFAGSPMPVGRVRNTAETELSGERKINKENWVGGSEFSEYFRQEFEGGWL